MEKERLHRERERQERERQERERQREMSAVEAADHHFQLSMELAKKVRFFVPKNDYFNDFPKNMNFWGHPCAFYPDIAT